MRIQTFVGKVSLESLKAMDEHINAWVEKNQIQPRVINQTFGYERHHHHEDQEPVLITSIWY